MFIEDFANFPLEKFQYFSIFYDLHLIFHIPRSCPHHVFGDFVFDATKLILIYSQKKLVLAEDFTLSISTNNSLLLDKLFQVVSSRSLFVAFVLPCYLRQPIREHCRFVVTVQCVAVLSLLVVVQTIQEPGE